MTEKNKNEDKKIDLISHEIMDAITSLDQENLVRSESCPHCSKIDISEMLDESKKKKEEEYKIGNYLVKKTLGQGTFGKVKLGIYLPTQEKVAIKILEKDRIVEKDDEIRVKREFDMLASFNHPNVILVAEIFESTDSFYSVMEYCAGGELFNFIVKRRRLNEEEAAFFYYQLINGLEYIHSLGIVHRDLKPENLLLTKDHVLKIIDFGLSNYFREGQEDLLVTPCGSPCYASPEMVAGNKYNGFKIDIWSTGIILYAMLCGYLPFEDKDNDILFEKILECKLDFPKYITDTSRDLIEKILVTDPNKRIDIPQIKEHPFFIKGKEIFEQEFSVCQIKKENNESEDENVDLNNILKDIEDRIDKDKDKEKDKDKNEDNNKIEKENNQNENKVKEHEIDNNNTAQRTIEDDIQNINLEQENIKPRLNTEYEERRPNLSNEELDNIDKNEKNKIKPKNKSSNKNGKKKIKNKKSDKNKKNDGPFKRNIVLLKNDFANEENRILKRKENKLEKSIKSRNPKYNKKLVKTNKYNNIKKQLTTKNRGLGKSTNGRNYNYLNTNKNIVSKRINYTNIIKNQFNSKENIKRKLNRKENIYSNKININNTIDNGNLKNKKNTNFDYKFYNSSLQVPKKNSSVEKKNNKISWFETTYNKKYLDNLFNISSSIRKYEKKLNSGALHKTQKINNKEKIKSKILGKNNNNSVESNINKYKKDRTKRPHIKSKNNNNENINIIDNTKEGDITIKDNPNINNINIKTNIGKKFENENTPKNRYKIKELKDKNANNNLARLKNSHNSHNSNIINNNQDIIKNNLNLNEIDSNKKTIEVESTKNSKKNQTSINSASKKNNHLKLKSVIIEDFNKKTKNNKKEIFKKENTHFRNKKGLALDSSITHNTNNTFNTIDSILKTEPDKQNIKQKLLKKENQKYRNKEPNRKQFMYQKTSTINTSQINNRNKNNKKQNNFISNYSKNLNKTSHNFNVHNSSKKNPFNQNSKNILELINPSPNRNEFNKIAPYSKKSQVITNNLSNKKNHQVTIKNTVINFNIDTGLILASLDKKRRYKRNKPKKGAHNSVSTINNKKLYDLAAKYNNHFLGNSTINNINHSNTNENFPVKNKVINSNITINSLSLNDKDLNKDFDVIKKSNNYQKMYINGNKGGEKKIIRANKVKDIKNENRQGNNRSANNRYKRHVKYRSMKLDDFYGIKGRKKNSKYIHINTNDN